MPRAVEEIIGILGWELKPGTKQKLEQFEKQIQDIRKRLSAVEGIARDAKKQIDDFGKEAKEAAEKAKKIKDLGFDKALDKLARGFDIVTMAAAGTAGVLAGLGIVSNREVAIQTNLAKSLGVSASFLDALGDSLSNVGFDYEKAGNLIEELNNKIGESAGLKPITPVIESLKILNLEFKELRKLSPEQQFTKILDTAKELKDQQKAVSAVDILMGGEANKILGFLRTQEGTLADIIARQQELNFLTDKGREGAVSFTGAFGDLSKSVKSVFEEFSGLLGGALNPMMESGADWIRQNKELIKVKISEWVDRIRKAIEWLRQTLIWLWPILKRLPAIFKVLMIFMTAAKVMKFVGAIQKMAAAWRAAGTAALWAQAKMLLIPAAIALIILALEDVYRFLEGSDETLTFRLLKNIEEWLGVDLIEPMRAAWPKVKAFWSGYIQTIVSFFGAMAETFGAIVTFIGDIFTKGLGEAWENLVINLIEIWGRFVDVLQDLGIINFLKYIWEGLIETWNSIVDSIKGIWGELDAYIKGLWNDLIDWILGKYNAVVGKLRSIPGIGDLFGEATAVTPTATGVAGGAISGVQDLAKSFSNVTSHRIETTTNNNNVGGIVVNAAPGQSPENIARAVKNVLQQEITTATRSNLTGIER